MSRGNTLEDIGRKAVEASEASSLWRIRRGLKCQRQPGSRIDCPLAYRARRYWCQACLERVHAKENRIRAKNSLLVAIRSYIRRTAA